MKNSPEFKTYQQLPIQTLTWFPVNDTNYDNINILNWQWKLKKKPYFSLSLQRTKAVKVSNITNILEKQMRAWIIWHS